MRRALAYLTPLAGILAAQACTTSIQVGMDGPGGGHGSSTSSGSTSSSGSTTTRSSSSSGTTVPVDAGMPDPACWDGNPVSGLGGPCGGLTGGPPSCVSGLTCHYPSPDATGTCAPASAQISPPGEMCGGFAGVLCSWDAECVLAPGSDAGTCVYKDCSNPPGNGCTNPEVTVAGFGPTQTFDFLCQDATAGSTPTSATGYIGYPNGVAVNPEEVWVKGCSSAGASTFQGSLLINAPLAMVGSTTSATVEYVTAIDQAASSSAATLNITQLDADTIAGTYKADVTWTTPSGVTTSIWGRFRVCRTPDFLPP